MKLNKEYLLRGFMRRTSWDPNRRITCAFWNPDLIIDSSTNKQWDEEDIDEDDWVYTFIDQHIWVETNKEPSLQLKTKPLVEMDLLIEMD